MAAAELSAVAQLAHDIGVPLAAFKLLLSMLVAYPLMVVYNLALVRQPRIVKNLYFLATGLAIGHFNFGIQIGHTILTTVIVYILMSVVRNKTIAAWLVFIFATCYLLTAYWMLASKTYEFAWTIPQCVLTLRLIAVAWDVADGKRLEKLKKDQDVKDPQEVVKNPEALAAVPSLLDLLAHTHFPGAFLVGPQFCLKRYQDFVIEKHSFLSRTVLPALICLMKGVTYLAVCQVGAAFLPHEYMLQADFEKQSFWYKFTYMAASMKFVLCKYLGIWLIAEGSCIMSGLTFDKATGKTDSCTNVYPLEFETTPTFAGCIHSFNIGTNKWALKYLLRRLRFLGSKPLSHIATLMYLAAWHGWNSGYYVTFSLEFLIIKLESDVLSWIGRKRKKSQALDQVLSSWLVRLPLMAFFRVYLLFGFGYALVPFVMLNTDQWWPVLSQVHFLIHIFYLSALLWSPLLHFV